MFETDDLILRKNEKNFILTLLEVPKSWKSMNFNEELLGR